MALHKHTNYLCITIVLLYYLIGLCQCLSSKQLEVTFKSIKETKEGTIFTTILPFTNICIGESNQQCFNIQLDFESFSTWVINAEYEGKQINKFNMKQSTSLKIIDDKETFFKGEPLISSRVKDVVNFGTNIKEIPFIFQIVNTTKSLISDESDGVLGLGYLNSDNNLKLSSFMYQLVEQKLIDFDVFSIDFINENQANLFIGNFPPKIEHDYSNYGICDLSNQNRQRQPTPKWECWSSEITYDDDNIIKDRYRVVFSLTSKYVTAPYDQFDQIWALLTSLPNNSNMCIKEAKDNIDKITCKKTDIDYSIIGIKFEDWKLSIPIGELFNDENESVLFTFIKGNNEWVLGYSCLRLFTLVFNRHNEEMGLYNTDWVTYYGNELLEKPTLSYGEETSFRPKQVPIQIKPTNSTVSFIFNLFMIITFLTVIIVVMVFVYDYLKKSNMNDKIIPYYSKGHNDLLEVSSRSSKV